MLQWITGRLEGGENLARLNVAPRNLSMLTIQNEQNGSKLHAASSWAQHVRNQTSVWSKSLDNNLESEPGYDELHHCDVIKLTPRRCC